MSFAELGTLLRDFFSVNSYGSLLLRAAIWFAVALIIIATTDTSGRPVPGKTVRQNLGMFFLFLLLCGGLMYLLFGFVPIA